MHRLLLNGFCGVRVGCRETLSKHTSLIPFSCFPISPEVFHLWLFSHCLHLQAQTLCASPPTSLRISNRVYTW